MRHVRSAELIGLTGFQQAGDTELYSQEGSGLAL